MTRTPPRILMLDDDPYMLELQAVVLRAMGCPTVVASDGEHAMVLLLGSPHTFDLVICDLNMPGNDGIDFLQALESSGFLGQVILLSGESMRVMNSVRILLGHGPLRVLGAIQKPASRAALVAVIANWEPQTSRPAATPRFEITHRELLSATEACQWVLHYQPKVDLRTGKLVGLEALVRWQHPIHGLIFPDQFIDRVEDCGAIDGMTRWVLKESMTQRAAWKAQGLPLQIAINLSVLTLQTPGVAEQISTLVRECGGSCQDVILEITESRLMSNSPAPLENLLRLTFHRFGLSIDDFGTGHSSLKQLRDVPFSELKVDRCFVRGARRDPVIRPILECSIAMAQRLSMKAVAEGVETEDDWNLVREMDCDFAQGYFISRPMAPTKVLEWAADWEGRAPRLIAA